MKRRGDLKLKKDKVNIDEIINKAAKAAVKEYASEQKNKNVDKRLHNTWLLMKNYNILKEHINNISDDVDESDMEMNFLIDDEKEEVWLRSVTRTKMRTIKMMSYLDSALSTVEKRYKKNKEESKYKAFKMYYLDNLTNEDIAEKLNCSKNIPKKWSDIILRDLSILLWGIEALNLE